MSEAEQIVNRITHLSPEELGKLKAWFGEFDARARDRQNEADTSAGKLDRFIEESIAGHEAGKS